MSGREDAGSARAATVLSVLVDGLDPDVLIMAPALPDRIRVAVTGITLHDPLIPWQPSPGHLLLAVGVDVFGPAAVTFVRQAAAAQFTGVVFHVGDLTPAPDLPGAVREEAVRARLPLLVAPISVPWALLSTAIRVGMVRASGDPFAVDVSDLFAFANTLAVRLRGSVTVEDPGSHVLAYSSVGQAVDEPRKQTILGRRVPHTYRQVLRERGIFRALFASEDCIELPPIPEVQLSRRVAITVRGGGEVLGSIWVAEEGQPLVADYPVILREAASSAALHIMRHHLDAQAESNLRRSMTRDLLDGHNGDVAAVRLGLEPRAAAAVVALEPTGRAAARVRLREAVELHCSISGRAAEVLELNGRVYIVLTADGEDAVAARRFAVQAAREASRALGVDVRAGVGDVRPLDRLVESRRDADRVLRVLLRPDATVAVAELDDVRLAASYLDVIDLLRDRPYLLQGPLDKLEALGPDRSHALLVTVRAYLDFHGDIASAAASLTVHPNTFRYRLRRFQGLTGADLSDPVQRVMLLLQLSTIPS